MVNIGIDTEVSSNYAYTHETIANDLTLHIYALYYYYYYYSYKHNRTTSHNDTVFKNVKRRLVGKLLLCNNTALPPTIITRCPTQLP